MTDMTVTHATCKAFAESPRVYRLEALLNLVREGDLVTTEIGGRWYPARPMSPRCWRHRFRAAWLVFTGKADAVIWPAGQ